MRPGPPDPVWGGASLDDEGEVIRTPEREGSVIAREDGVHEFGVGALELETEEGLPGGQRVPLSRPEQRPAILYVLVLELEPLGQGLREPRWYLAEGTTGRKAVMRSVHVVRRAPDDVEIRQHLGRIGPDLHYPHQRNRDVREDPDDDEGDKKLDDGEPATAAPLHRFLRCSD